MGGCGGAAVDVLELLPAVLRRTDGMIHRGEEADDGRERCHADEAEHDPAGCDPHSLRHVGATIGEGVRQADDGANRREDEGDRARVPHGVLEGLTLALLRHGSVRGTVANAPSAATIAVGTSSRSRARDTANTTTADTASATAPPLLCVPSRRQIIAVLPPSASARIASGSVQRAATAIAGQNAITAIAASPFQYVTGKSRRPLRYKTSGSPPSRSRTAVHAVSAEIPRTTTALAASLSAAERSVTRGVSIATVEKREQAVVARQRRKGRPGRRDRGPDGEGDQQAARRERQSSRGRRPSPRRDDGEHDRRDHGIAEPVGGANRTARVPSEHPGDADEAGDGHCPGSGTSAICRCFVASRAMAL